MDWTEKQIKYIVAELAEENPLACQALYRIAEIQFSSDVPTMAVSLEENPRLYINLNFCKEHLRTEYDVKTILIHEFLHVLLGHTKRYTETSLLLNIATDAVINAIIHRTFGTLYSNFFRRFYGKNNIAFLLRPPDDEKIRLKKEKISAENLIGLKHGHLQVYNGTLCADDLNELLESLRIIQSADDIIFLGDHSGKSISKENSNLLDGIIKKIKPGLIWGKTRGTAAALEEREIKQIQTVTLSRWKQQTYRILQKCLIGQQGHQQKWQQRDMILPVLNTKDRRAMARFFTSRAIPLVQHATVFPEPVGSASIYLDVSGSMDKEIKQLMALLYLFRGTIQYPLWVFSNDVYPARFRYGKLLYKTSHGTSIQCVFEHLRKHAIQKCLILTDGYFETIRPEDLHGLDRQNIHFLLSAEGSSNKIVSADFSFHQLQPL